MHFILYCVCYCNKSFYCIKLFYSCVSHKLEPQCTSYICFIIIISPRAVKSEAKWKPAQYTALNNSKPSTAGQKHPLVMLLMTPLHFAWSFSLFFLSLFHFPLPYRPRLVSKGCVCHRLLRTFNCLQRNCKCSLKLESIGPHSLHSSISIIADIKRPNFPANCRYSDS